MINSIMVKKKKKKACPNKNFKVKCNIVFGLTVSSCPKLVNMPARVSELGHNYWF